MKKGTILLVEIPMNIITDTDDVYPLKEGDTVNVIDDMIYLNTGKSTKEISLYDVTLNTSKELLGELIKLIPE